MGNCTLAWRQAQFEVKIAQALSIGSILEVEMKVRRLLCEAKFQVKLIETLVFWKLMSNMDQVWKLRCRKSTGCCYEDGNCIVKRSFVEKLRVTGGFSPPKIVASCVKVAVPFVEVEVYSRIE